ncbi:MAG: alpha/beta fold hydrolase [Ferruginibacter sp.]
MNLQKKIIFQYLRAKINALTLINTRKAAEYAFKLFCTPIKNGPAKESKVFKDAEKIEFLLEDKKICGFRFNHPQPQKALILHGFSSYSYKFDNYVTALVDKNYEVLAFDAPAHGHSEGKTTNALEYKNMIEKVIELYGPIHNFIAHSFGGLAVCLALEEMPPIDDIKIVLIAPATETTTAINTVFKMLDLKNTKLRTAVDDHIYKISGHKTEWFSIRRAIKNIKGKVLWIHDEDDDITPLSDALKVKEDKISYITYIITKGLGHRKIYRDEAVKKAVIDFL